MEERDANEVAWERAAELLEHSSTGVEAELERARGWLESSKFRTLPDFWEVDAVAGALGSLANIWGRLNMWSRAIGAYERLAGELERAMDELVDLRRHLMQEKPGHQDVERLKGLVEKFDRMRQELRRETRGEAGSEK